MRGGLLALVLVGASSALAHDPGLSSANVELARESIAVVLTFNERDVALAAGVPPEWKAKSKDLPPQIRELLGTAVLVQLDGSALAPASSEAKADSINNVEFRFVFPRAQAARALSFHSQLLKELPFGHRQVFTIYVGGRELRRAILSAGEDTTRVTLEEIVQQPATYGFLEFLLLGIRHILAGYDHLLFLFGLLVMCRSGRTAALLISCFTLAHSLTLALSTFGLVHLPSRYVEAAIAASILYIGVENLLRREQTGMGRAFVTFLFGLVHGLGFASVLREMGVANSGAAAVVPLVGFNTGVEVGQLSVAAIILPIIWLLRRGDLFIRVGVRACSMAVALAGAYWLLDRTVLEGR